MLPPGGCAQNYFIDWFKISAGGGTSSNGTNSITITAPAGNLFFRLANP